MESMKLTCGRFIPRTSGGVGGGASGGTTDMAERVARLEWYVARLSEELELLLGAVGTVSSAWSGNGVAMVADDTGTEEVSV